MFEKVSDPDFVHGEHQVLRFWRDWDIFQKRRALNAGNSKTWSFLDGPMTANNPMGVHHAWGRTYKDAFQRFFAMTGHDIRYQNGFDCQGLWVEVEVEKQLGLGAKSEIEKFGIDKFVHECKRRVLKYAAIQTEQSIRLGYWMEWDDPKALRELAEAVGTDREITFTPPRGEPVKDKAEAIVARLGNVDWGGSYFTFSTENNETIWAFLKKCYQRGKVYRGYDVMPWSGRGGSAYSQMEVADGRKLHVHRALFVKFPLVTNKSGEKVENEHVLIWTTTPWTLTSNVAAMVNPELDYAKLRMKKDGAVYYCAKENLDYQRLAKEFKEGFGRPEWQWPKDCPKLKTLGQILKEQGGYEVEAIVKGAELVGATYRGPFDVLPAQSADGGLPEDLKLKGKSGVSCHAVVDGGRDFKGNANVVAGEGTGIVHSAPGCGDVDHQIGAALGLVSIAPLDEEGRFLEGFGPFTGLRATDAATVDLVIETLREQSLLIAVEQYPHIYPFCWRTGDELVFRLVDEWFINMDWREEIMAITRQINWLPDSIGGQERELEWLAGMRDWMVSKKRYWGLALPIWVDEQDPQQFEVLGSLAELKERAVEGWNDFDGHTPHRPWIDGVKIRNPQTGNLMSRVQDVGNPWLDAGIVPFSTVGYGTHPDYWQRWFPADLVTECFPGQFRNWFYSLLSLGTMMGWKETFQGTPPFKTLFGYRLVMNEAGKPMHKSDGTAIWFEEAAEQLGVDTMRWMYLAQNPASDLRFGTRVPDQKVTLDTPDGPADTTIDGVPTCLVKSGPADETRRQTLIPLWNSYAFFVNYARLDEFDVTLPPVPVAERPEIDRWLLSNLNQLIATARREFAVYNAQAVMREASRFIDDLSNWYIRRNRRRFWRSRKEAGSATTGGWDGDKLAAYQTLYETLVTLSKLLAPAIPFLSERMYQNLVVNGGVAGAPESVHLCDYPEVDESLVDLSLSRRMALAQLVVNVGHGLREKANQRVRQPLGELRFATSSPEQRDAVLLLSEVIAEELNVKRISAVDDLDDLVKYAYKPNLKTLGPKYGKSLGAITKALATVDQKIMLPLRSGKTVTLTIDGAAVDLGPDDVLVSTQQAADWVAGDAEGVQLALSTQLTPELVEEGIARDFVRQIQQLRKDADLEIEQRIRVRYVLVDEPTQAALGKWSAFIQSETLAEELTLAAEPSASAKSVEIGSAAASVWIEV